MRCSLRDRKMLKVSFSSVIMIAGNGVLWEIKHIVNKYVQVDQIA